MTVRQAYKIIESIDNIIHNLYAIQGKCSSNDELWESFADACNLNIGYRDFTATAIKGLCSYKNLLKDKINDARIDWGDE